MVALRDKTREAGARETASLSLPGPENEFVSKEVTQMKQLKMRFETFLLTVFLLLAVSGLEGQAFGRFVIQPGSRLWTDGTSNVHDWTVEAVELDGFVALTLPFVLPVPGTNGAIGGPLVDVSVPVAGLKSGYRIMDWKMAAALKSSRHPMIRFKLREGGISAVVQGERGRYNLAIRGVLEVAGVSRVIEMDVEVHFMRDGKLTIEGRKGLKMSDFGIEAPKALGGLMVTGDEIQIRFSLEMAVGSRLASRFLQSWATAGSR